MSELLSVIIPVYNVEDYLDRCIQSVVSQTYPNLEILVVDDGSPDRCPEICDAWAEKDPRIQVIHKENGGLSSARAPPGGGGIHPVCGLRRLYRSGRLHATHGLCARGGPDRGGGHDL